LEGGGGAAAFGRGGSVGSDEFLVDFFVNEEFLFFVGEFEFLCGEGDEGGFEVGVFGAEALELGEEEGSFLSATFLGKELSFDDILKHFYFFNFGGVTGGGEVGGEELFVGCLKFGFEFGEAFVLRVTFFTEV